MFFDIGFWEIGLIFIVALLVFGPEKLPGLIRQTGFLIGKAQSVFQSLRAEMDRELTLYESNQELNNNILNPKSTENSSEADLENIEDPLTPNQTDSEKKRDD